MKGSDEWPPISRQSESINCGYAKFYIFGCGLSFGGVMGKIAYLESGRTHDRSIEQIGLNDIVPVPEWKVRHTNLMRFAAVIINSSVNQDLMWRAKKRLERYVQSGGIVVILGANSAKTGWLPYCTYFDPCLAQIELRNDGSDPGSRIFSGLPNAGALSFHDTFVTHGYFTSTLSSITPLVWEKGSPQSLVMAILQPPKAAGKLLVTTLDPDYHATARHALRETPYDKNAARLLRNIVSNWLVSELSNQPNITRFWRRAKGISTLSLTWAASVFMIGMCLVFMILIWLSVIPTEWLGTVGSASSIISLVSMILLAIVDRRR
jgi:hypothetical protein